MEKDLPKISFESFTNYLDFFTTHLENLNQLNQKTSEYAELVRKRNVNFNLSDFKEIHRLNSFKAVLSISLLDLMTVFKNMSNASQNWEYIYFIKQAYLIIYETLKSYDHYNQMLNKLVSEKYTTVKELFLEISKLIKNYKNDFGYQDEMKRIRNHTTGHIDNNFELYYKIVTSLDFVKAGEAIKAFLPLLFEFKSFTTKLSAAAIEHQKSKVSKDK